MTVKTTATMTATGSCVAHSVGCCCNDCDMTDRTQWGYNSKGNFVKFESDDDFTEDENGNYYLRE